MADSQSFSLRFPSLCGGAGRGLGKGPRPGCGPSPALLLSSEKDSLGGRCLDTCFVWEFLRFAPVGVVEEASSLAFILPEHGSEPSLANRCIELRLPRM